MIGVWGLKLYRRVRRRALPIHLFRHCRWMMYRLATMHSVTDKNIMMIKAKYDRPKIKQHRRADKTKQPTALFSN